MRIDNNISFGAKKPVLRRLDDINRGFIQEYSYVKSPTKLLTRIEKRGESILEPKNESYCNVANLWDCKVILLREKKFKKIEELIAEIRKEKCANCQELSDILFERLVCEGYKPKKVVFELETKENIRKMKDHMFLLLSSKNNEQPSLEDASAIVVDPFFAFVDYLPSAIMRFSRELGLKDDEKLKFKILDK